MKVNFKVNYRIKILMLIVFSISISCNDKKDIPIIKETTNKSKKRSIKRKPIPVFGYRFIIEGDFDGDGKKERLTEHFISGIDKKETSKYYDAVEDYWDMIDLTIKKEPISYVLCDNTTIDTLKIHSGGQLFGISYLKNEGDLNGDGTDELSYVVDWADYSNFNSWHIMTYKNGKWKELLTFPIWDWQLPDLPVANNRYSLFGSEGKKFVNDTVNIRLMKELKQFEGLVKKIKTNKIQVIFMGKEAEIDTIILNMKHLPKKIGL
jgi:hypothetical protein